MNAFHLAFAYLRFNWIRSLVLVLVTALILAVPIISQVLLNGSRAALTDRADATPLVLGSRGSQLDLVMNALYFSEDRAEPVTMAVTDTVWNTGLGLPIPMNTAFETNGSRIIGTSLDYFDFRGLEVADGRGIAVLGEAVLGADVAARLALGPGDTVVSSPENLFDLDGVYPLELNVVGVFAPTGTPDDEAVFVDIKTSWVISGIGHGHDGVMATGAEGEDIVAAASILEFNRITDENIDSFHFHGDPASYPVSAIILVPSDERAGTILRGRYLDPENPVQVIVPKDVVGDLVDRIFRIKTLLDAVSLIIGTAALAAIGLAIFLSYRLRAREMQTAFKLGARRGMIVRLLAAETFILLSIAGVISLGIVLAVQSRGDTIVAWLLAT
ncbi:ABC-type transport system, involved in lipoprotein release, permease component [Sulfitobacter noctilucae]|uniref:ABC transporter permease n=1 Tax=Sulfitobacter noctilucae TaxID=1342302 RepID=UPI0004698401|nr:ABC transporter permease [Sulfitobacter noctilucae]KIN75004.1 ABC-type transport system, involved in lipoprotein release, permease component [Sulfitobacter noctilucae]